MKITLSIVVTVLIIFCGNMLMGNQDKQLPTVNVALGIHKDDVIKKSSYPIKFDFPNNMKKIFEKIPVSHAVVTGNVNFIVTKPHEVIFNNIRYWNVSCEENLVNSFSGDTPLNNINDAFTTINNWTENIDNAGWVRVENKQKFLFSGYPHDKTYNKLEGMKKDFLKRDDSKINGARAGSWFSADKKQRLSLSLTHKRQDGGPRYPHTPLPKKPLEEVTYILRFTVMYNKKMPWEKNLEDQIQTKK